MKIGVIGCGAIGLAYAAWLSHRGYDVLVCSPRNQSGAELKNQSLTSSGVLEAVFSVSYVDSLQELAAETETLIVAVPANGHRMIMDGLLPYLKPFHRVIVSATASLSSLYLYEQALLRGIEISVASLGSTALTARRKSATHVQINVKRKTLGVSCLPSSRATDMIRVCHDLFGIDVSSDKNPLFSTLGNTNAVSHVPLAIFNWTRIERAEVWPQYHYMTPLVAETVQKLDAERMAVADAFGWQMISVRQKLTKGYQFAAETLADAAAALHRLRGGPAGPVDVHTRYLTEDVPYGLVFTLALGRIAQIEMPATTTMIETASMILDRDFVSENELLLSLRLSSESVGGLTKRVSA